MAANPSTRLRQPPTSVSSKSSKKWTLSSGFLSFIAKLICGSGGGGRRAGSGRRARTRFCVGCVEKSKGLHGRCGARCGKKGKGFAWAVREGWRGLRCVDGMGEGRMPPALALFAANGRAGGGNGGR
eukprot:247986-Chlamydomonas_euryale.AAC.1